MIVFPLFLGWPWSWWLKGRVGTQSMLFFKEQKTSGKVNRFFFVWKVRIISGLFLDRTECGFRFWIIKIKSVSFIYNLPKYQTNSNSLFVNIFFVRTKKQSFVCLLCQANLVKKVPRREGTLKAYFFLKSKILTLIGFCTESLFYAKQGREKRSVKIFDFKEAFILVSFVCIRKTKKAAENLLGTLRHTISSLLLVSLIFDFNKQVIIAC